jgi:FkbM family methyltransferase
MLDSLKQNLLIRLSKAGWNRHPKEIRTFLDKTILTTRGAFFRKTEKDDGWLFTLSRSHHQILDIGCNIGQSSLLMLVNTNNNMLCVDPNPNALSRCAENLIFNNLATHVKFINAFVGAEDGQEIDFFTIGTGAAGSMFQGFAKTATKFKQSIKVKTKTASTICRETAFLPDLIKIDVEGAEILVLNGIDDNVLKNQPTLFVEMHSGKELSIKKNTQELLDWCAAHEYDAYYLRTHSILKMEDVLLRGRYHALLLPKGKSYPDELKVIPENATLNSVIERV